MDRMKPCRCGSHNLRMDKEQVENKMDTHFVYAVTCIDCGMTGPWDLGKSGAAEGWNGAGDDRAKELDELYNILCSVKPGDEESRVQLGRAVSIVVTLRNWRNDETES